MMTTGTIRMKFATAPVVASQAGTGPPMRREPAANAVATSNHQKAIGAR
jgi:hypothetical protein